MDSGFMEEQVFREDRVSSEFRWRRGSVREEQNWNNKIVRVQGKLEISEKGWRGRPVTQLDLDRMYTQALVLDAKPPFASKAILL